MTTIVAPIHACERALERYGMTITVGELRAIEDRLARGEGMILRRNSDGAEVRVLRVMGELVSLVYGIDGFIKTFLPPDAPFKRLWRSR